MRVLHLDSGHQMRGGQYQVLAPRGDLRDPGHEGVLLARQGAPLTFRRVTVRSRAVDLVPAHNAHTHTRAAIAAGVSVVASRPGSLTPRREIHGEPDGL